MVRSYLLDKFCWMMEHSRLLRGLILATFLFQAKSSSENSFAITVSEIEERVYLSCKENMWRQGTEQTTGTNNKTMDLGKRILDPRGTYLCQKDGKNNSLQIYYRMCQNCVELDSGTFSGLMVADVIATLLLALGVYCFAGHETGRISEAANSQVVMRNDQLYQPLRERNNDQYSSLGENWRNK